MDPDAGVPENVRRLKKEGKILVMFYGPAYNKVPPCRGLPCLHLMRRPIIFKIIFRRHWWGAGWAKLAQQLFVACTCTVGCLVLPPANTSPGALIDGGSIHMRML
jgi:hypothetical protein